MARRLAAATKPDSDARVALLDAAEACLHKYGYSGLSTRRVADAAGMPLSRRLLERQRATFAAAVPLWKRWEKACDYLDEDIDSGYVRILQEMIAAGWSNREIAQAVRSFLAGWYTLLEALAKEAAQRFGNLGGLKPDEVACLVGAAFLGGEAKILLGFEEEGMPVRRALRRFGSVIRKFEQSTSGR